MKEKYQYPDETRNRKNMERIPIAPVLENFQYPINEKYQHPDETRNRKDGERNRIAPDLEDFQNPIKVFHHIDRVQELLKTGDTRPIHMNIGFTNYCNHKCPWCYINWTQAGRSKERSGAEGGMIKAINADDRLIEAVEEATKLGLKAVTIVGDGEPTLHKKFTSYLPRLKAAGLDIGIFSNFSYRNKDVETALLENCFFVRGSLDAASPKVHEKSHGSTDFDLVISNLKRLIERRGSESYPIIGVQYVVNQWNYMELPYAAKFYRDIGVDYFTIKPAYKNVLNPAHEENELSSKQVMDYLLEAMSFKTETYQVYAKIPQFRETLDHETNGGRYYSKCFATPLSPYLDEDGNLEMCGNLKGRGFTMGNIYENSFEEIWNSSQRKGCLGKIDLDKCPAGCRLDPLNKVLWDAHEPERDRVHPNFL